MLRWRDSSASMYMVVMSRSSCLLVSSSDSTPANLNGSELNSYKFIVAAMFSTAYSVYLHGVPIKTVLFRRILHKRDTCNALVSITCKTSTTSLFLDDCKSSYSTFLKLSFFLSDLQQLSKIHDSSLTATHSARKFGFIFDEHLTSQTKSLHFLNPATIRLLNFAVSAHISTSKQLAPSPPPLSILNSITVTLCITTFQTINLTGSNRFRTLLLVLLLRLRNPHISLLFSNLSTGLTSTNALNINFFLLPTKFLHPVNLAILTI